MFEFGDQDVNNISNQEDLEHKQKEEQKQSSQLTKKKTKMIRFQIAPSRGQIDWRTKRRVGRSLDIFQLQLEIEVLNSLFGVLKLQSSFPAIDWKFNRSFIQNNTIKRLSQSLKCVTFISKLSLDLNSCHYLTDHALNNLSTSLKKRKGLKHLSLNFIRIRNFTENELVNFSQSLRYLKSLQILHLEFEQCFTDKSLRHLSRNLGKFEALKDINICLNNCSYITDSGFREFHQLKHVKSLKKIWFRFTTCPYITNEGVGYITQCFNKSSIRNLLLTLNDCPWISDVGIDNVNQVLKGCKSLHSITLGFSYCKITDIGLMHLAQTLKSLPKLVEISFDLRYCKDISSEKLTLIKADLASQLPKKSIKIIHS